MRHAYKFFLCINCTQISVNAFLGMTERDALEISINSDLDRMCILNYDLTMEILRFESQKVGEDVKAV